MTIAPCATPEREELEAVRARVLQLDAEEREHLGQHVYREAERRGLVLALGFDELSGAARLGELGVLTSMLAAMHHASPRLLGDVLAAADDDPALVDADAPAALAAITQA